VVLEEDTQQSSDDAVSSGDGPLAEVQPLGLDGAQVHISPIQEARAQDLIRDLAASPDIVFVRLIAPDGVALAMQGAENGDITLDASIAGAMMSARHEADGQSFGEPHYLAVESEEAALLVAPVHEGAMLAVYTSNPARLGLLRRQVRKPVLGLRSLLMESSVS
jgi:predicted regulator of Ras-like GTPase activity (Roadblock/LC7/MglB family)